MAGAALVGALLPGCANSDRGAQASVYGAPPEVHRESAEDPNGNLAALYGGPPEDEVPPSPSAAPDAAPPPREDAGAHDAGAPDAGAKKVVVPKANAPVYGGPPR